jgi:hypothetical protein
LQHSIATSDKEEVKAVITKLINNRSQKYSQQNINNLLTPLISNATPQLRALV